MKKLNKLKLNEIAADNLSNREMKEIKGGTRTCRCSCYWVDSGGSSFYDNCVANYHIGETGGKSEHGDNQTICWKQ